MGCEGQFEQPADRIQSCHVTFLHLHISNKTLEGKNKTLSITEKTESLAEKRVRAEIGSGGDLCTVKRSLIVNKEVTVGGTWHTLLAHRAGLQVMAGCFV